ncbi:MAG: hypothetical protein ACN4E2_01790, partial [Nitrospinota bacterium]
MKSYKNSFQKLIINLIFFFMIFFVMGFSARYYMKINGLKLSTEFPLAFAEEQDQLSDKKESKTNSLDIELWNELQKRELKLNNKEQELKDLQDTLNSIKDQIRKETNQLQAIHIAIEESINIRDDLDKDSIDKLAKAY